MASKTKKLKVKKAPKKRVATKQDITVRNRRAIDRQLDAEKRSMLSHLSNLREVIDSLEARIKKLENTDKR